MMKFSIYRLIAAIALVIYLAVKIYNPSHPPYYGYLLIISTLFVYIDVFTRKKIEKTGVKITGKKKFLFIASLVLGFVISFLIFYFMGSGV